MPDRLIQSAADRLALIYSGTTGQPWYFDGAHNIVEPDGTPVRERCPDTTKENETHSRLNAEYIYALQPRVGLSLSKMLESQAVVHLDLDNCYYCNKSNNPLGLECPVLHLAREIMSLEFEEDHPANPHIHM